MEASKRLLATANRILAQEGVLDAFGHASLRDPADASRFILSRSLAPELVTQEDILAFDLMSQPIGPTDTPLYSERVIHGAIYRARPDVMAICHHHAPPLLPFCLADLKLRVVTQLGATIGKQVPVWDQRDEFGATNHLVVREDEAVSLARCLGPHSIVLMKRHGATVVGSTIEQLTFRSIYSCRDAELQLRALTYGAVDSFSDAEIDAASRYSQATLSRAWEYWNSRLAATPSH
ncbi:MAG: class II aldolase/adducin family protein [Pseudolabrys sp.]|nr:class II aldolase/adducin family protein [Pseudolabrys sp.]MDP2295445.1 class II aldolase/adducin family protein [Pseudolabrys sp.]